MEFKREVYKELKKWKEKKTGHVLELQGARQVGKTYILTKFAKENFKHFIYINMADDSGQQYLRALAEAESWTPGTPRPTQTLHKSLALYDIDFLDTPDTVVIIDEIQESKEVYNRIRNFAREFKCYVIVTGSYLGKLLDEGFFLPAGDTDMLEMSTLNFKEFLDAFDMKECFDHLDLYGSSEKAEYDAIREYFEIYLKIGGYPAVVATYMETQDIAECETKLWALMRIFVDESKRYFDSITDVDLFERIFQSIVTLMLTEKRGTPDLVSQLSKIADREESGIISKKVINHAISWLQSSHIIGYADKCINCNRLDVKTNNRIYFMDLGIAYIYLKQAFASDADIKGILAETYVYQILRKHIRVDIAGNAPWFATWENNGELDFYVLSHINRCAYGIEVKSTNNSAKTAQAIFRAGKLDYLYYLKGDAYGGIVEDGKILTVPLPLASRITFDHVK